MAIIRLVRARARLFIFSYFIPIRRESHAIRVRYLVSYIGAFCKRDSPSRGARRGVRRGGECVRAFYKQIKRVNPTEPQFLSLFLFREKREKDETIFPDSLAFITAHFRNLVIFSLSPLRTLSHVRCTFLAHILHTQSFISLFPK